jgi:diguanylate cyclase (GGDEF)-like protein/PAS domain S-box-containing protein
MFDIGQWTAEFADIASGMEAMAARLCAHSAAEIASADTAAHLHTLASRLRELTVATAAQIEIAGTSFDRLALQTASEARERKRVEEMLANREREFNTLVEHSRDTIVRYDRDYRRIYVNPAFAALAGEAVEALVGKTPLMYLNNASSATFEARLAGVFATGEQVEFEFPRETKDGRQICQLIKLTPEFDEDGAVKTVLAVGRDITDLRASYEKIHQMAFYDGLTGLPNRARFDEALRDRLAASPDNALGGVMMIDVDHFKGVNDTMGHTAGDALLREVGRRLRGCMRRGDMVARFGGDEFAVLLAPMEDTGVAGQVAAAIIEQFDHSIAVNGTELFVSCSIGIALCPQDGRDADDLMKHADSAMYLAKRSGRRAYRFYSSELTRNAVARLALESDLRRAIARDELELHYQPKVSLPEHEMIGSEALLRWRRPGLGLVPPDTFIPIAEDTGLIAEFGEWVLREACRSAVRWNGNAPGSHKVAVNLSARQFQSRDLAQTVAAILAETGCRPEWIELEITERLLLAESDQVSSTLWAFKSAGLSLAIDDFGTGYSSLSYLTRFPIDTVKIDKSFVQRATRDRRHGELVKAILSIARCLGQQVVAEGVETGAQADFLAANGCRMAQGFLFSKPLPHAAIEALPRYLGSNGGQTRP